MCPCVGDYPASTAHATGARRPLRWAVLAAILGVHAACNSPLYLGSDLIWKADQETGDLSQWSAPNGTGGIDTSGGSVSVTSELAHTGQFSIKLTSIADSRFANPNTPGGGGVYREETFPTEAYYSIWYYLPQYYQTVTSWAILKFKSVLPGGETGENLDLRLESQPNKTMTLVLYDHRQDYLRSPLSDPPAIVPIGQWFQIEAFYRNADDPSGHLTIWFNGVLIYDVSRKIPGSPTVYFMPCSLVNALSPANAILYVDDVAVSWSRIGPGGILEVPQ
jgi:hypothetical protein